MMTWRVTRQEPSDGNPLRTGLVKHAVGLVAKQASSGPGRFKVVSAMRGTLRLCLDFWNEPSRQVLKSEVVQAVPALHAHPLTCFVDGTWRCRLLIRRSGARNGRGRSALGGGR